MSGVIGGAGSKSGFIGSTGGGLGCYFIMSFSSDIGWQNVGSNVDVPFTSIEIDDDNCCTSGTGAHFKAPIKSKYFFGCSIYVGNSDDLNYFTFYINDAIPNHMPGGDHYMATIGDIDVSCTGHIVYDLKAGDTVSLTASSTSRYYTGHTLFYGYRVV